MLSWIVTGCSSHITALGGIVMVLVVTLESCIVIWPLFLKLNRCNLGSTSRSVNINTPGSTNNFNTYLVLVVPDSNYNQHIPLLIGTNVLNTILQDLHHLHGDIYLQNANPSRSIGSNAKSDAWWIADVLQYWVSLSQ
jgi:hypothetical protein